MPRYAGEPQHLDHKITLALDTNRVTRADACAAHLSVPRAEAIRRAIDLLYLTLFSSNPIDSTMQSGDTEGASQ
jgi:hypothetical protein